MAKYYKIIVNIICVFGCIYQTINLSQLYFSYETTTNVSMSTGATHTFPVLPSAI